MNLQDLNTQQLKAVQTVNKPVLVFAGAGSGKTRVLTYKVWHLIKENLFKPNEILALTFTNKAAAEMKVRIQESISQSKFEPKFLVQLNHQMFGVYIFWQELYILYLLS